MSGIIWATVWLINSYVMMCLMMSAPVSFSRIPFSIVIKLTKPENYNIQKFT